MSSDEQRAVFRLYASKIITKRRVVSDLLNEFTELSFRVEISPRKSEPSHLHVHLTQRWSMQLFSHGEQQSRVKVIGTAHTAGVHLDLSTITLSRAGRLFQTSERPIAMQCS